jgi:uncharacterized protein
MAIRDFMQSPDVIGIIEADNLPALKRLAAKINADSVAAGKPDPKYEAILIDGNDGRGIDNGFLVKTSRVKVIESKQLGKENKYKNPDTNEDNFLNDRTPLMLRASIDDTKSGQPFEFTVVVNHLKSFLGYSDPKQKANVRMKKRLQAEFLAKFVQERQTANPKERIILLGDFNAFQFNDGILDVIGTIKGKTAGKDEILNSSEDLVNPDLIDLVDVIAAPQRYSYVYDGNAQVLDHIIISETLRKHTTGFGYARINADFPEVYRNDGTRLERFSDHDPAIAFFTFDDASKPPDVEPAPTPTPTPQKQASPFEERYVGGNTPPKVFVKNDANRTLNLKLNGVVYTLKPAENMSEVMQPGQVSFEASAPGVRSLSGIDVFKVGYEYYWTFYIVRQP